MKARRFFIVFVGVLLMMTMAPFFGYAEVPLQINYQGYLTDLNGDPVADGDYTISFSIYNVPTDGDALWGESQTVAVRKGVYNVILGQLGNELNPAHFDGQLYLGVTVAPDTDEMTPRQLLTSVPFAIRAGGVPEGFLTTVMIADEAVTGAKIASDEVVASHIATGAVGASEIEDDSVSSGDVGFNYAGSDSKGGPAMDLACSGCVSETELDFTTGLGDITAVYTGAHLEGGAASGEVTLDIKFPLDHSGYSNKYPIISATNSSWVAIGGANLDKTQGYLGHPEYGVYGKSLVTGNFGYLGDDSFGVWGEDFSTNNHGYLGSDEYGVYGESNSNIGVYGKSQTGTAVHGHSVHGTGGYFSSSDGNGLVVAAGRVGIGTLSPEDTLHVQHDNEGVIKVGTATTNGNATIIFEEGSTDVMALRYDGTSNDLKIDDEITGNTRMIIGRSGSVGIGTTSPDTMLEVNGDGSSWSNGFLALKNLSHDAGIRIYDGDSTANLKYSIYNNHSQGDILRISPGTSGSGGITITETGSVGIGTTSPNNAFDVVGTIRAEEIIVDTGWADYVFEDDYVRMDLDEVEKHIGLKGHLPGMPTEAEVKENGIGLGAFQAKLLEKIEELTLYIIDQKKEIDVLKRKVAQLKVQPVEAVEESPY